jgi:archaemetzincin
MSRFIFRMLVFVVFCPGVRAETFVPPSVQKRTEAVGSLEGLDPVLRRAFSDAGEFEAKKMPGAFDWLATHAEPGQTYWDYCKSGVALPRDKRTKLYLLPIGLFDPELAPDLEKLKAYTAAYFFPMTVEMLPVLPDAEMKATSRINPGTGKKQWLTPDILKAMWQKLPADAYAMLAVTMTDLYPDDAWNFVFGHALAERRVGVFSFARYHPAWSGEKADDSTKTLVLRRSVKVLTHEMGHMFGIDHCIHFQCNMNGANHLEEADTTPLDLCPVCLRKLHRAIRFDPVKRYEKLLAFDAANDLKAEAGWIERRIEAIQAASNAERDEERKK